VIVVSLMGLPIFSALARLSVTLLGWITLVPV